MSDFSANRPMTERREMVLTVGQGEGDLQGGDDRILWCGIPIGMRRGSRWRMRVGLVWGAG